MAHSWTQKLNQGLSTAAQVAGAAHSAYQVGKAIYGIGSAVAPYAALLL
jgi:hypothetical protein